jgi:hypothetical protein
MKTTPSGLLIVRVEADPRYDEELNAWYDDEHMAERLAIPGFMGARRWVSASEPYVYLATYDVESLAVFESAAYLAHFGDNQSPWSKRNLGRLKRFERWTCELATSSGAATDAGGALFMSAFDVLPNAQVLDWYDQEHLPWLCAVPGVLHGRRFTAASGTPRNVSLYEMVDVQPPDHPQWAASTTTPWAQTVIPRLVPGRLRGTYRAYPKTWARSWR